MPRGNVTVRITGHSDGLSRSTRKAEGDLDRFGKRSSKSFAAVKKAAAGASLALGGALVIETGRVVKAFAEAEKSNARMRAQLDASGISYRNHAKEIENVIAKTSQLAGLDDEDLQDAFTNLVRTTGDVDKSLRLVGVAADLARGKQIDVAKAGEIVAKVAGGNTGILSRYGITLKDGATAAEALGTIQEKFAGQAKKYGETTGGALDRVGVAAENLEESVGSALAPAVATGANALAGFIVEMQAGEGHGGQFRGTVEDLAGSVGNLGRAIGPTALGVGQLGLEAVQAAAAFGQTRAGMVAMTAVAGALAGRMVFLAGAWAVERVLAFVGGIKAAIVAMRGLGAATAASGIGAIAVLAGTVAGALLGMSTSTAEAAVTARDLNSALQVQADALRAVRDIDIDVAQRKANVASANVAVEGAEKRLADLRRAGKGNTLEARQAEADLAQARIQQKRAQRELGDAEEDANRKRRTARETTRDASKAGKDRIQTLQGEIDELEDIKKRYGEDSDAAEILTRKQEALRKEINRLKSKSIVIDVQLALATWGHLQSPGKLFGTGDGWGLGDAIQRKAQAAANEDPTGLFGGLKGGGANLMGANANLGPFALIASTYGLSVTSGYRPGSITSSGNQSYHAIRRAIDINAGSAGAMLSYAQAMAAMFGGRLKELIHTPLGFSIKNGQRVAPYAQADHYDHVHVAMQTGGTLVPGSGSGDKVLMQAMVEPSESVFVLNRNATATLAALQSFNRAIPRRQSGGKVPDKGKADRPYSPIERAALAARAAGFKGEALKIALAVAASESINFTDMTGDEDRGGSYGPWMVHHPSHPEYDTQRLQNDWTYAAKAAYAISSGGKNWGPWTQYRNGGYQSYLDEAAQAVASIAGVNPKGGGKKQAKPKHGARDTFESKLAQVDIAAGFAEQTETLGDDKKVFLRRARLLNARVRKIKARLKKIDRALKGKLTPQTRKRLLGEKGSLLTELGQRYGELRENPYPLRDRAQEFADAFGGGGGTGGGGGNDALVEAIQRQTEATQAHTALLTQLSQQNQKLEYLLNTQSPQILDQIRGLFSTAMMRTVTLSRQAAGQPGRAASL